MARQIGCRIDTSHVPQGPTRRFVPVDVLRKFARLSLSATLLATVVSAFGVGGVSAAVTVGSAWSFPPGGCSTGFFEFHFGQYSANAFPPSGGTLSVTLSDSLGAPTVHFRGLVSVDASATLPTTAEMGPALSSFTLTITGSNASAIEQVIASGVQLTSDQVA